MIRQAIILAAGRGQRMRPLTDTIPKPLLRVAGKPLIQYHVENLAQAGIDYIVINHAYLGPMIEQALGDGSAFGVKLVYSAEGDVPLETAGGIIHALPLLDKRPFIVINADIFTDLIFTSLVSLPLRSAAHLLLVDNPSDRPRGDFSLVDNMVSRQDPVRLTYSGIGVFCPAFFAATAAGPRPLAPLLNEAVSAGKVSGQYFDGLWVDVGTPARLQKVNEIAAQMHGPYERACSKDQQHPNK